MPFFSQNFELSLGPVLDVRLNGAASWVARLRAEGRPIPQPQELRALIDTGADCSLIDSGAIEPLLGAGLPQAGASNIGITWAGGVSLRLKYECGLRCPHPSGDNKCDLVVRSMTLFEHRLGELDYQILLGRDFLARCLFLLDGSGGSFTLAY